MTASKLTKLFFNYDSGVNAATSPNNNPDGLALPASTITVFNTANFTNSGQISFYTITGTNQFSLQTISYTGKTATTFTGCSGGTGTLFNFSTYPSYTVITQTSGSPVSPGQGSTWTAPPGVKWVWVTGCGGGGGGGSGASISSTNISYPYFIYGLAGGGGGGQAAITATHAIAVVPGTTYQIAIGLGGLGGIPNPVWNGNPFTGTPLYPNNYGGACWGNVGNSGQSSIFGTTVFPGGLGGRRGEILTRVFAANEMDWDRNGSTFQNFDPGANAIGTGSNQLYNGTTTCFGCPAGSTTPFPNPVLGGQIVQPRVHGIWNPPGIQSSSFTFDQVLTIGVINNSQFPVANAAPQGLNDNWLPGSGGGGGGGGGGASNNIYSFGGGGGQASFGNAGNNFAGGGGFGAYGGGGGGGGGGEGVYWNNTHDGAPGGNGGPGFIEIAWIQ